MHPAGSSPGDASDLDNGSLTKPGREGNPVHLQTKEMARFLARLCQTMEYFAFVSAIWIGAGALSYNGENR